jgi:2-polyprenyl-3-methyl-5-hydroxy-6-metoxy-1,4-benzoquinol methylase
MTAERYGWKSPDAEKSHSYLLPAVISILKEHRIHSLLDIGTGNGATLPAWLAEGLQVAAIEPDREGFVMAREHKSADVRNIAVGDPLPDEWKKHFDAVLSLEVVEHLFDPHALVLWAKSAVKRDGIVIISTPYHGYFKNLALALAGKWDFHHHALRNGGHIKFWSRRTLKKLFEGHGLMETKFIGTGRMPYLWKSMIMVFKTI